MYLLGWIAAYPKYETEPPHLPPEWAYFIIHYCFFLQEKQFKKQSTLYSYLLLLSGFNNLPISSKLTSERFSAE